MASTIKADTLQSTTSNIFFLNSVGTEYARFDSSGVFQLANSITTTFPAGTAALPSISTIGDTNTGIFFPAADTIAFAEGGVESMRIDSSGNVKLSAANTKILNSSGNPILQQTGSVLQVVSTTNTSFFTTTSASFTDITGLSVSITPTSATSKIFVICNVIYGASVDAVIQLVRNSTAVGNGTAGSTNGINNIYGGGDGQYSSYQTAFNFLDSPATTSATTYKIQILATSAGTAYVNRRRQDTTFGGQSTITVMEIAA
jgi:hypothetical protein